MGLADAQVLQQLKDTILDSKSLIWGHAFFSRILLSFLRVSPSRVGGSVHTVLSSSLEPIKLRKDRANE